MANHKSALKRTRQNENRRLRNKSCKSQVKNSIKRVRLAVDQNAVETVVTDLNDAKSVLAKAAKKGVIHRKTAARKISRLSKLVNTLSA